jgi:signal transduction histidine kinase
VPGPAGQRAGVIGEFQAELPTPEQVHRFLVESGIALALMTVVSIWLGWVMAGRALRPLRSMTATARQISEENLNQRLAVKGPQDEMKDLGDTIDSLLERLETAFDAQRRFVANASQRLGTDRVVADSDGAGLGLSIVRAIATAHGGTLQLRARPHGGLRVVIELAIAVVPV